MRFRPATRLRRGSSVNDMFEFIDAERAATTSANAIDTPPVTRMCTWLEVSRSGFYEWRSRPESATARRREELKLYVQKSFDLPAAPTATGASMPTWRAGACRRAPSWSAR